MNRIRSILQFGLFGLVLCLLVLAYNWTVLRNDKVDVVLPRAQIIESDNNSSIALYEAKREGQGFFLTIDDSENKNFTKQNENKYELIALHRGDFWDPKRCSQMQNMIFKHNIVFLDSVVSQENKKGFTTLLYFYDTEKNILKKFETETKLVKLFKKEEGNDVGLYALAVNTVSLEYILYKIDYISNKLIFIKSYHDLEDFNLVTATDTLAWCKDYGKVCVHDTDFNLDFSNNDFEEYRSIDNVFETKIFRNDREIFIVNDNDRIRYFFIGMKDPEAY